MKYFNNPKTKAELTEQYRELLIKYNYKSSKSKATINEITNEYNQLAKEIDKKINGPSAFDIIKDGIKLYYNKKDKITISFKQMWSVSNKIKFHVVTITTLFLFTFSLGKHNIFLI